MSQALRLRGGLDLASVDAACAATAFAKRQPRLPDRWIVRGRDAKSGKECAMIVLVEPNARETTLCVHGYPAVLLSSVVTGKLALGLTAGRANLASHPK